MEAVVQQFIVQPVHRFVTTRLYVSQKEMPHTHRQYGKSKIGFGKPPAKYAANNIGQIKKRTFASTAKPKSALS